MESSGPEGAKPELVHKLEGSTDEIHGAVLIPGTNMFQLKIRKSGVSG
jgi:hypothetical protein